MGDWFGEMLIGLFKLLFIEKTPRFINEIEDKRWWYVAIAVWAFFCIALIALVGFFVWILFSLMNVV